MSILWGFTQEGKHGRGIEANGILPLALLTSYTAGTLPATSPRPGSLGIDDAARNSSGTTATAAVGTVAPTPASALAADNGSDDRRSRVGVSSRIVRWIPE